MSDSSGDEGRGESRGKMLQRHKRELKELQGRTAAILHAVKKNDKKGKVEVQERVRAMEEEVKNRHLKELADYDAASVAGVTVAAAAVTVAAEDPKGPSRAQLRREKQQEKDIAREREIAEIHAAAGPSLATRENEQLAAKLDPLQLGVVEIRSDGHCLYRALAHQLSLHAEAVPGRHTVEGLRALAADYLRQHRDEFRPFMVTNAGTEMTDEEYTRHCEEVASTTQWGGQTELMALASALRVRVEAYTADGAPLVFGEEFPTILRVSFHKHRYALGAHYNSVVARELIAGMAPQTQSEEFISIPVAAPAPASTATAVATAAATAAVPAPGDSGAPAASVPSGIPAPPSA
ncbi:putative cysteine proteinase [Paratrimastix pyriformis]|uniref:Cysteine proteinase n=1 Tax=Paratrimastix pyriformis TaxID=342808 RepID=A0ABQ8USF3_9EUKA|nr:putative cysteine proteinase [Paratrimastix pyriformis]